MTEEQKVARKKAKEIREKRKHLVAIIENLDGELSAAENLFYLLQNEQCKHPSLKRGISCGRSWERCDDCHYEG